MMGSGVVRPSVVSTTSNIQHMLWYSTGTGRVSSTCQNALHCADIGAEFRQFSGGKTLSGGVLFCSLFHAYKIVIVVCVRYVRRSSCTGFGPETSLSHPRRWIKAWILTFRTLTPEVSDSRPVGRSRWFCLQDRHFLRTHEFQIVLIRKNSNAFDASKVLYGL